MKKINFLTLIFAGLLLSLTFTNVKAQEENPTTDTPNQKVRPFRILEELGLTREQIQQIRRINQERKPIMQEAQMRWREANRNLDMAIYADNPNDEEVQARIKEAQAAQTELIKERATTEFLIRKVLTTEQLLKFRQLRQRLMQQRMDNRNNPNNQQQRPVNRLQQRKLQNRQQ